MLIPLGGMGNVRMLCMIWRVLDHSLTLKWRSDKFRCTVPQGREDAHTATLASVCCISHMHLPLRWFGKVHTLRYRIQNGHEADPCACRRSNNSGSLVGREVGTVGV